MSRRTDSLCEATGCTVCNRNYMECSECLSSEGFVYRNGHCVLNFEPTYISFGFWDYKENLLKVSFNMVPEYRPSFEAVLDHVSVVDLKTSTTFSSKELNATATQTKYGFLLKFSPNETIVSGVLRIQQSANLTIMDRESRQVYSGFPIEIPGVYIIPPSAVTETVDNTLETASESRSLITLAIFSFNPMVAVALDFMFSELFVLKLYEGPFMAYPELLLRSTTESTILPVKIPNLLESDIEEDECVPSKSFQMNDMGCVFLDNYGDDIQKLLLLFAGTALISLIGRGILCCVSKQSQVTKGKFVTAVEFISVNYGLQMFHAKMEGEKMEVMVHLLLGMSHRRQSVFYTRNLVVMAVLQAYYWAVGVLGVTFTAEVGRFMSRSPLILALLRKHRLEIEKQTSMSVPNKPEDAADRLILIPEEDEVPKQPVKPAIAHKFHLEIPEENFERSPFQIQEPIFDPNEDLEICSEHVQGYPVINKTSARLPGKSEVGVVKQSEHSGKQESRKAIQSTVLRPSGQSATFVRIASASTGHQQALGIGPANIAFPIHIPEIACEGPQQEQQSSKKQAVTKRILLGKTAEGENTFPMYQEQTQTVTNRERTSFRLTQTPKHHSSQAKSSSKHPAPRRQKPAHFTQYIVNQSSSTYFSQMLKAKMERKIPEDFRPEAKEYFEFDKHTFSQISFFAAENTVTNNTWYRFAPLASFARASLLGIIVTRVVGHPQTQIICGMVIELIYLWYIVKAKYKSSLLEHRIDVTLQFLQILYLAQKLLTVFSILSDELKQDYLGLPMAVTLGLIAGVNIVFVLFNMGMLVFEVGVLIVTKIKDKFRQRRSTRR